MRTYEALYIVQPDAAEDEVQTVVEGVESLVAENGGSIVRLDVWGKRRLAYNVKGFQEGIYVLTRFESIETFPKKLEDHFRLNESVIRSLLVHIDEKTLRLEIEQARRNKAALESRNASGPGERRESREDDSRPEPRVRTAEEPVEA